MADPTEPVVDPAVDDEIEEDIPEPVRNLILSRYTRVEQNLWQ